MKKLTYNDAIRFWRRNDAAKSDLDRSRDPDGLTYGLYDDFPPFINRYYAFFQNKVVERFLSQVSLSPESRILEIGCGSGRWCRRMTREPHERVTGGDPTAARSKFSDEFGHLLWRHDPVVGQQIAG